MAYHKITEIKESQENLKRKLRIEKMKKLSTSQPSSPPLFKPSIDRVSSTLKGVQFDGNRIIIP
jgi:hypothetical protein